MRYGELLIWARVSNAVRKCGGEENVLELNDDARHWLSVG